MTGPYRSPYGQPAGLLDRLATLRKRLVEPGGPFVGLGPIADLDLVMKFLNVREYGEWLVANGDNEQARWGREILNQGDRADDAESLEADIERVLPVAVGQEYADAVEGAARKAIQYDTVRAVLEQVGALAPGDQATDVPALIRALLS